MSIFTPTNKVNSKILRRPDFRNLLNARQSGFSLSSGEIDYDELVIQRSWRSYEINKPDEVRYFMFELTQKNPDEKLFSPPFYKAIRMIRLTRVPRYLRQGGSMSGPDLVFEQMRDVLAALREQGTLFVNMIAKSPQLPLIFAYGVQGVGSTLEEAQRKADEAFAVLDFQLSGTYQQLMYKPISVEEGELISRYQNEWSHLAMGRGRPLPTGNSIGTATILDGNRSDVESTNNQLESFIRGMSDKSFLLSLVTNPLSPVEITKSWRNLTQKLTEVKSEISGTRSVNAGVAFPLVMGSSDGNASSSTHSQGTDHSTNQSLGSNQSHTTGSTTTDGINNSFTTGANHSDTKGTSETITDGTANTITDTTSTTVTDGRDSSVTEGTARTTSTSLGTSESHGVTQTSGTNQSTARSVGDNWSTSNSQSISNTTTETTGTSQSSGTNSSQTISSSATTGNSSTAGSSSTSGSNVSGGVLGTGGGTTSSSTTSASNTNSASNTTGISQTQGVSSDVGSSASTAKGVTTGQTITNSVGGSTSTTQTNGTSQSTAISDTTGTSRTTTDGVTTSRSVSNGQSHSVAVGNSHSVGNTISHSLAKGTNQSSSDGYSTANQSGTSSSLANSNSNSIGTSQSAGSSSGVNDAWAMAYSRNYASSGSMAVAPSFGVSVSKQTFDSAKNAIADMLDAQLRRYNEGLKSGAFFYQMFLVCPDRETLLGGAGLLKSAFWGAGQSSDQLPQPFHTITEFETEERSRLLTHANAFSPYRKREEVIELIEPFKYSSYLTPSEAAAFVHPPVVEGPGLLAVHDSMPVLRMPIDRQNCDIQLGHVVNGERGLISDIKFGINIEDLKGHALIAGVTGSGKTTTLMKLLSDAVKVEKTIVSDPTPQNPIPQKKIVRASILGLDWMRNMRNLASIPELVNSGRFHFYSLLKPELGKFRWNPLEIPAPSMAPAEWLNAQADNFTASFNLGEFGRSLISELMTDLYSLNRLVDNILVQEIIDEGIDGEVKSLIRPAVILKAIPRNQIPSNAIKKDPITGLEYCNVFTFPELSRTVSMSHLSIILLAKIENLQKKENETKITGTAIKDRYQSLWRRLQYFSPSGQFFDMLGHDENLEERTCLTVTDIVNPDKGVVSIIETDGLDVGTRRLVLGSILLAIYRFGLHYGDGTFDHNGKGPGTFIVMEESHELFGNSLTGDDSFSIETRTALYEGLFRRVRALGIRLLPVAQQPSSLPESVTANVNSVFIHKVRSKNDREKVFSLLNWSNNIGQQMREYRYLGEIPTGYCIARLDAKEDYTESAPIQFKTELPTLDIVSDNYLKSLL